VRPSSRGLLTTQYHAEPSGRSAYNARAITRARSNPERHISPSRTRAFFERTPAYPSNFGVQASARWCSARRPRDLVGATMKLWDGSRRVTADDGEGTERITGNVTCRIHNTRSIIRTARSEPPVPSATAVVTRPKTDHAPTPTRCQNYDVLAGEWSYSSVRLAAEVKSLARTSAHTRPPATCRPPRPPQRSC